MDKNLNPPQLSHRMVEVFASVVANSGISAAARALQISQPSVSRMIDDLESATGLVLFIRRGRSVIPTPEAAALYSEVQQSFVGLRQIAHRAQQLHQHQRRHLTVGCLPALAYSFMPEAIASVHRQFPDIKINFLIEESLLLAQMVTARQVDIGFVAAGIYPTGVQKIASFSGLCRCILPNGHRLTGSSSVTIAQLIDEPFVTLFGNSRIRQRLEELYPHSASKLRFVAETRQASSASELVLRGVGIAIVGPWVAHEHVRRGGASVPLEHAIVYETDVIAHSDSRLNEAARAVLASVTQQAADASL